MLYIIHLKQGSFPPVCITSLEPVSLSRLCCISDCFVPLMFAAVFVDIKVVRSVTAALTVGVEFLVWRAPGIWVVPTIDLSEMTSRYQHKLLGTLTIRHR